MGRRGLYKIPMIFGKGLAWKIGDGRSVLATSSTLVEGRIPVVRSNQKLADSRR